MSIPKRNPSGARDLTAHDALAAVQREQDERIDRLNRLIGVLRDTIDLAGYDLVARIEVRDRETGRVYR